MLRPARLDCLDRFERLDERALGLRLLCQAPARQVLLTISRDEKDRRLERDDPERPERHPTADPEEEDQVDEDEHAIEHHREHARREHLANRRVAVDAHQQVARRTALEEAVGQPEHVLEEAHGHTHVEMRSQVEQQLASNQRREEPEYDDPDESHQHHEQERLVISRNDAVHDSAVNERDDEREDLQNERHHEDLLQTFRLPDRALEVEEDGLRPGLLRDELLRLVEDERHPGEAPAHLALRERTSTERGVDDVHQGPSLPAVVHPLEHDEVREVPVEDRGGAERVELVQIRANTAPAEVPSRRRVHDRARGDAVTPDVHRAADVVEPDLATVVREHHREAGGAAVRRHRLHDERHVPLGRRHAELRELGQARHDGERIAHGTSTFNAGMRVTRSDSLRTRISARPVRPSKYPYFSPSDLKVVSGRAARTRT